MFDRGFNREHQEQTNPDSEIRIPQSVELWPRGEALGCQPSR
jgi:hypothetical protein